MNELKQKDQMIKKVNNIIGMKGMKIRLIIKNIKRKKK